MTPRCYSVDLGDGLHARVHGDPNPSPESAAAIREIARAAAEEFARAPLSQDDRVLVGQLDRDADELLSVRELRESLDRLAEAGYVEPITNGLSARLTPAGRERARELRDARAVA